MKINLHCLSFYLSFKKSQKFQPSIEEKQLKVGGKSHCEINPFSSSCWTQLLAPNYCNVIFQDNSSEFSPIMPEEFGEHLIRDQRPFSSSRISPDPSDSQLHVSTSSLSSPHSFSTGSGQGTEMTIAEAWFCAQ